MLPLFPWSSCLLRPCNLFHIFHLHCRAAKVNLADLLRKRSWARLTRPRLRDGSVTSGRVDDVGGAATPSSGITRALCSVAERFQLHRQQQMPRPTLNLEGENGAISGADLGPACDLLYSLILCNTELLDFHPTRLQHPGSVASAPPNVRHTFHTAGYLRSS